MTVPLIYNLFPRLVGPTTRWPEHAERAAAMRFNWLYLNPWHYPGFSGSLYAPKEFRRLNPLFAPAGADTRILDVLERALHEISDAGLRPMMDLVINHTAKDAVLADEHPEWYVRDERGQLVSPFVRDPDDPAKITVWGDLAEIDNESAPNREALWAYWAELVRDSVGLGFRGFRCDAAYKVPAALWKRLIDEARRADPEVRFFAETLGAPMESIAALADAGFDYIFNSSKWWDFRAPWALEQHERFRDLAPSIAFPESHDTPRLAAESGGSEAIQKQRYAFAAAFSAGVMMPVGYEFGFRTQVNVVRTMPADWERRHFDLSAFIARVNSLKLAEPSLQGEGELDAPWGLEGDVLLLERRAPGAGGPGWILVNKEPERSFTVTLPEPARGGRLFRVCRDDAEQAERAPERLELRGAEVAYVLPG
jgi:starch synthase (maltosyl-transferring)